MPNYGFNENEIVSTQTIMIDKDGFYKVVDGASGGDTGSKDFLCLMDASNGSESAFSPILMINPENRSIADFIEYTTTEGIYDQSECKAFVAINPINTDKISNYPTSINIIDFDFDEFVSEHNIVNSEKPGWLYSKPTSTYINNVRYNSFNVWCDSGNNMGTPYHLPFDDYEDNEAICKQTEDGMGYWYEFDATIIMICKANDEGIANVCTDILHIVTETYSKGDPK